MEDHVMGKKVVENFHIFSKLLDHDGENFNVNPTLIPAEHFQLYTELLGPFQKTVESVFYHFLNKVYDSEERDIK